MPVCRSCGGRTHRIHRKMSERFRYAAAFRCSQCDSLQYEDQWYLFLLGKTSRCPNCGSYRVRKLRAVDKIDRMYKNPLSYWQKFLGAELFWCPGCRLQYYDLRKRGASVSGEPASAVRPVGLGEESAVHPESLAGDKPTPLAGEEHHHPGDVERLPNPSEGS